MNPDATVVFNKSKLAKAIHEEADAGPSGADHFCQSFLCDLRNPAGLTGVHAHSGKRNLTVEDRTARVGITSSIFFLGTLRRALEFRDELSTLRRLGDRGSNPTRAAFINVRHLRRRLLRPSLQLLILSYSSTTCLKPSTIPLLPKSLLSLECRSQRLFPGRLQNRDLGIRNLLSYAALRDDSDRP
jgi:hypothetical protein